MAYDWRELDWKTLDARSLRIYRGEARANIDGAQFGKALANHFESATEQQFATDLAFWEARQAAIEAELTRRGLDFE